VLGSPAVDAATGRRASGPDLAAPR
jgi:hypothetical protein